MKQDNDLDDTQSRKTTPFFNVFSLFFILLLTALITTTCGGRESGELDTT